MSHSFPLVGVFVSPSLDLVLDTIPRLSTCHQVWERHWDCTSKVQVVGVAVWLLEEAQYFCCERHKHLVVTLLELLEHLLQTPWEVSRVCSDLTQWSWHRLPHGFLLIPDILGFHIPMKVSQPQYFPIFCLITCSASERSHLPNAGSSQTPTQFTQETKWVQLVLLLQNKHQNFP